MDSEDCVVIRTTFDFAFKERQQIELLWGKLGTAVSRRPKATVRAIKERRG